MAGPEDSILRMEKNSFLRDDIPICFEGGEHSLFIGRLTAVWQI